jgi:hypothetical protein
MAAITELKLRTDFILDRMKFLESVCEAVHNEDTVRGNDLLTVLLDNDYPSIIARLLADPNMQTRDQATWTLANLLGSDQQEVRVAANKACLEVRAQIFDNLIGAPNGEIQRGTAYLLFNWLQRFGKNVEVDEQVLRLLDTGFIRSVIKKSSVRSDLLHAVASALRRTQAGTKAAREVVRMLQGNTNKRERSVLLQAFSEICSEDGETSSFSPADHAAVFDLFEELLLVDAEKLLTAEQQLELLWALSNFVCEPEVADKFFTRANLRLEMVELCESDHGYLRAEAGWVLMNAIKKSTWESTQEDIGTDYALRYALCSVEAGLEVKSGKLYAAIHESLDSLSELEALFAPLEEDEGEDALTEIAEEEEIVPGLTAAEICEMAGVYENHFNLPCERPTPTVATTEAPLPSAFELMVDHKNRNGSAALRSLVFSLKNAGAVNIPVPAGTVLSIEDLTLMGSLGYTISQGYFGINPYLTSVRYF